MMTDLERAQMKLMRQKEMNRHAEARAGIKLRKKRQQTEDKESKIAARAIWVKTRGDQTKEMMEGAREREEDRKEKQNLSRRTMGYRSTLGNRTNRIGVRRSRR